MLNNMLPKVIDYTLKIWLTCILVAPVIFLLILLIKNYTLITDFLQLITFGLLLYSGLVILQILFSFITLLIFIAVVRLVLFVPVDGIVKTIMICIAGIVLTSATFFVTILHEKTFVEWSNGEFFNLMFCDCICIGFGVWYYKLENYSNNKLS